MTRARAIANVVPLLVAAAACSLTEDLDPLTTGGAASATSSAGPGGSGAGSGTGGESSRGGAGGGGGAGGCGTPPGGGPPGACPMGMIKLAFTSAEAYCIDRTEVSREKYKAWLDSGCPSRQPAECEWNDSFEPALGMNDCELAQHSLDVSPQKPVVCVDWCDARAYCEAAGKRLCGGKGGGMSPFAGFADAGVNEWYSACSQQGSRPYPYGDVYQPTTCVGDDFDGVSGDGSQDDSLDVGTAIGCRVGMSQLFDMSGNVWEWESSCDATVGADDICRHRGGSFWDPDVDLRCDSGKPASLAKRSQFNKNIGIRCCADVNP